MTIPGVGPQHTRAAEGTDARGWLVFSWLPTDLQDAEDSRQAADFADPRKPRTFQRPASDTERQLLAHLGFDVPAQLNTTISWPSRSVRRRRWIALENQEVTP
jgi:hypothetical protein